MKHSGFKTVFSSKIIGLILLLSVLFIYFKTACPTIAPYRDSGELICAASTLSIAHSPGYPLYLLLGKIFINLGAMSGINKAYSMNLMSAVFSAIAVYIFYLIVLRLTKEKYLAFIMGLVMAFSYMHWYLSVVAEMYSLNTMLIILLIYLVLRRKYYLAFFGSGLMLGNHLSSLFAALPLLLYVSTAEENKNDLIKYGLLVMLGLNVYMYLPLRAASAPFINWGDPSNIDKFLKVITRASYGHTLDLVSREVSRSQVIIPQFLIFFESILRDITPVFFLLSLAGIYQTILRSEKDRVFLAVFFAFIMTGPLFVYIAKMPVNPHSLAIVEVSYIVPVAILLIFASLGLHRLIAFAADKGKVFKNALILITLAVPLYQFISFYPKVDKSDNKLAKTYSEDILNSVGPGAIVVMRRDHPLFAAWYMRYMKGSGQDVKVVSKGLLSSEWYRKKLRADHPDIDWGEVFINDDQYIDRIVKKYSGEPGVYFTPAAAGELSRFGLKQYKLKNYGLVIKALNKNNEYDPDDVLERIGEYAFDFTATKIEDYYDYFSRDFISYYAVALDGLGSEYIKEGKTSAAADLFKKSIFTDSTYFRPYANLAYISLRKEAMPEALSYYQKALDCLIGYMNTFTRKEFFYTDVAENYNNIGAAHEKIFRKSGNVEEFKKAAESYKMALKYRPDFAKVYYNLAVLYWPTAQWERIVSFLKRAAAYEPENKEIKKYLAIASSNLRQ